ENRLTNITRIPGISIRSVSAIRSSLQKIASVVGSRPSLAGFDVIPFSVDAERVELVVPAAFHTGPGVARAPVNTAVHNRRPGVHGATGRKLPEDRAGL